MNRKKKTENCKSERKIMNGGATKKPTRKKSVNQEDFNLLNRVPRAKKAPQKVEDAQKIFKYIDDNVIGKGLLFLGPYGRRKSKS